MTTTTSPTASPRRRVRGLARVGAMLAPVAAASLVLGACAPDERDSAKETASEAGTAASEQAKDALQEDDGETSSPSNAPAGEGDTVTTDGVTMTVTPAKGLHDGDTVSVKVTGADPEMGYYLALCAVEKHGPVPTCIGNRGQDGKNDQQWFSEKSGKPVGADGTISTELTIAQSGETEAGETLDCATDSCVVKLFGDHRNGFVDVVDVPASFS